MFWWSVGLGPSLMKILRVARICLSPGPIFAAGVRFSLVSFFPRVRFSLVSFLSVRVQVLVPIQSRYGGRSKFGQGRNIPACILCQVKSGKGSTIEERINGNAKNIKEWFKNVPKAPSDETRRSANAHLVGPWAPTGFSWAPTGFSVGPYWFFPESA